MMNQRENLLALLRKEDYEFVPVEFSLCPDLVRLYREKTGSELPYEDYFELPWRNVDDIRIPDRTEEYRPYHPNLKKGGVIDLWGIAHEPGSEAAKHMTYMRCPLRGKSLEEIKHYPFPDFKNGDASHQAEQVRKIHEKGLAAVGNMQTTIWETSWYLRGMEDLMTDMLCDPETAEYIFDAVTERAAIRAAAFARAGVDIIFLGDDIGMQHTQMMSNELYCQWILPRLTRVIAEIRKIKPDIIVFYHSCGFVTPFIPYLIEAGVDVLNPIQSESMEFSEIYQQYGDRISFHGTIGTQTVMPFGTPEEVIQKVHENLDIAHGRGLFVAPTHLLEPEVPWENILAYVEACKTYPVKEKLK